MPHTYYHTGIKRDHQGFVRTSDGKAVELNGWWEGYPKSDADCDFLYWNFHDNSQKNTIFNDPDYHSNYFICEYFVN